MMGATRKSGLVGRALVAMPFLPRRAALASSPQMKRLHRLQSAVALRDAPALSRLALRLMDVFCWPFLAWRGLASMPERIITVAARERGRSARMEFFAAWRTCARFGIQPSDYYKFGLYRKQAREQIGDYIFVAEWRRLYVRLHRRARAEEVQQVDSKLSFWRLAREQNIPATRLLAIARHGTLEFHDPPDGAGWRCDIVMKPEIGSNGSGFYRWIYEGPDRYRGALGETLSRDALLGEIARLSTRTSILVQQRLVNDEQTAKWSSGALATVRVVTGRSASGAIEIVGAAIKMPAGAALVDNYMRGNVLTQVDVASGTLCEGLYFFHQLTPIDTHPDTGVPFAGKPLPQWRDIAALAMRTHALFPSLALVAFDIAPTPDGPVIVESNANGDLAMIQYPNARPLGRTAYPRIVLSHIQDDDGHALGSTVTPAVLDRAGLA
jgi:putative polysaccharide biosynthesis protein